MTSSTTTSALPKLVSLVQPSLVSSNAPEAVRALVLERTTSSRLEPPLLLQDWAQLLSPKPSKAAAVSQETAEVMTTVTDGAVHALARAADLAEQVPSAQSTELAQLA